MRLNSAILCWSLGTVLVSFVSLIFIAAGYLEAALLFACLAGIVLLALGWIAVGGYANITFIFFFFFFLYGVSGPLAAVYGDGVGDLFPRPYLSAGYLVLYDLAVIGLASGILMSMGGAQSGTSHWRTAWRGSDLLFLACLFAGLASAMELANVLRAGGFGLLIMGKAVTQSAISDLSVTLPSKEILVLSAALAGLGISSVRLIESALTFRRYRGAVIWLILAAPMLLMYIVIGRRGVLLAVLFAMVVGLFWSYPLTKIKPAILMLGLTIYILMSGLFGARAQLGYGLMTGDWSAVIQRISTTEFWVKNLNPAQNEFGAPFGNVNTYLLSGDQSMRLGQTYVDGFAIHVPRYIWPDKPRTATYQFRDEYFPDLADRGAIAGTAFSSILEAYMNFGKSGVFLVYALVSFFLGWLEKKRRKGTAGLFYPVFYLTFLPTAISFHRSALENPFVWPLLSACIAVFGYLLLRGMYRSNPGIPQAV